MESQALIKTIGGLMAEMERTRLTVVSRGAKLEEFNHKARYANLDKKDPYIEMDAQTVRKDMRELLKDLEDLAEKFNSLHGGATGDEKLASVAGRMLASARSLLQSVANICSNALQAHNSLRSSRLGVIGWNIHHDAQSGQDTVARVVKICQRVVSGMQEGGE